MCQQTAYHSFQNHSMYVKDTSGNNLKQKMYRSPLKSFLLRQFKFGAVNYLCDVAQ